MRAILIQDDNIRIFIYCFLFLYNSKNISLIVIPKYLSLLTLDSLHETLVFFLIAFKLYFIHLAA